jgi:hypothetical protein
LWILSALWPILVMQLDHRWWLCSEIWNSCFSVF